MQAQSVITIIITIIITINKDNKDTMMMKAQHGLQQQQQMTIITITNKQQQQQHQPHPHNNNKNKKFSNKQESHAMLCGRATPGMNKQCINCNIWHKQKMRSDIVNKQHCHQQRRQALQGVTAAGCQAHHQHALLLLLLLLQHQQQKDAEQQQRRAGTLQRKERMPPQMHKQLRTGWHAKKEQQQQQKQQRQHQVHHQHAHSMFGTLML